MKRPGRPEALEKTVNRFSSVVSQLEDSLAYLLKGNDYDLATIIVRALHLPVDPLFKPRLIEAIQKGLISRHHQHGCHAYAFDPEGIT